MAKLISLETIVAVLCECMELADAKDEAVAKAMRMESWSQWSSCEHWRGRQVVVSEGERSCPTARQDTSWTAVGGKLDASVEGMTLQRHGHWLGPLREG